LSEAKGKEIKPLAST